MEREPRSGNDSAGIKELDADSAGRLASVIAALSTIAATLTDAEAVITVELASLEIVAATVEFQREHATAVLVQSNSVDGTFRLKDSMGSRFGWSFNCLRPSILKL